MQAGQCCERTNMLAAVCYLQGYFVCFSVDGFMLPRRFLTRTKLAYSSRLEQPAPRTGTCIVALARASSFRCVGGCGGGMEVKENLAVLIDGIIKKYGSQVVLNHLHMKVPSGSM